MRVQKSLTPLSGTRVPCAAIKQTGVRPYRTQEGARREGARMPLRKIPGAVSKPLAAFIVLHVVTKFLANLLSPSLQLSSGRKTEPLHTGRSF